MKDILIDHVLYCLLYLIIDFGLVHLNTTVKSNISAPKCNQIRVTISLYVIRCCNWGLTWDVFISLRIFTILRYDRGRCRIGGPEKAPVCGEEGAEDLG